MAVSSAYNVPFDHTLTDLAGIETPVVSRGQHTWISVSSTAGGIISESRTIEFPVYSQNSGLNEFIGFELSMEPEVTRIYTAFRGSVFYVWTLLDNFETRIREAVYAREQEIIDEFPMFDFDFYLVVADDQDAESMISGPVDLVFQRL